MSGWVWLLLMCAAGFAVIAVVVLRKRYEDREERKRSKSDPLMEASFKNIIELRDQGVVNEWRLKDLRRRRPDFDAWLDEREGKRKRPSR
jgi:hypothetical protein